MIKLNAIIALTMMLHAFVFLPYNHGGVFLFQFEIRFINDTLKKGFSLFAGGGAYEKSLLLSTLFSVIGHLALLVSLFLKSAVAKVCTLLVGIGFMVMSLLNILLHAFNLLGLFIAVCSIPYLITALWSLAVSFDLYNLQKASSSRSYWD